MGDEVQLPVTPFTGVWIEISCRRGAVDDQRVTPFTGVWIEIGSRTAPGRIWLVTPFTGVWIEIPRLPAFAARSRSHPSRVCGLKLLAGARSRSCPPVTPFTGVWIEIWWWSNPHHREISSHPSRVCGLKLDGRYDDLCSLTSHPSRVCGLKYLPHIHYFDVLGHTLHGCVD